jgi:hypothetical protein
MRKAKGTPFKLRSASPFKKDGDPIKKDLGKKVNDANHLVNVSEERITVPDYSGNPGKVVKASKERCGIEVPMDDPRCVAYSKMSDDEIKASEQKQGLREGYEPPVEGGDSVSYKEENIASPGKPGDKMDPFTSSEYRVQTRLGKVAGNQAVKAARKQKRNMTDADFDATNDQRVKDGLKPFKNKRAWFKQQKSDIRTEQADAQRESSRNRFDQLNQGRNASRSGEQIEYRKKMSKGSDGTDFTVASDSDVETYGRTSDLEGYNSGDFNFKAIGKRVADMVGRGVGYGKKSGTPFKLNKYKK